MQVGPAILIEFTAPAAVVVYLWLRHGQRPGRMTLAGAGLAALGPGAGARPGLRRRPEPPGRAVGAGRDGRLRDVLHHQRRRGQRPAAARPGLGWPGRRCAWRSALLGLVGVLPMRRHRRRPSYADVQVAWWVPLVLLGLVTAALAYVAGIAAGRRLGSRLASFVALLEVVASVMWAWLLLDELPAAVQLVGGLLILAGVVARQAGRALRGGPVPSRPDAERRYSPEPSSEATGGPDGRLVHVRARSASTSSHDSGARLGRARPGARVPRRPADDRRAAPQRGARWPTSWSPTPWRTDDPTATAPSSSPARSTTMRWSCGSATRGRTARSSRGRWSPRSVTVAAWPSSTP